MNNQIIFKRWMAVEEVLVPVVAWVVPTIALVARPLVQVVVSHAQAGLSK